MPLHADEESRCFPLDSLYDTDLVPAADLQSIAEPVYRLMVQGVHAAGIAAQDRVEPRSLLDMHGLARQHRAPVLGIGVERVDIAVQRAAERDIDHLRAAADAEDRHLERQRPFQQSELERVAVGVDPHIRQHLPTIELGADIIAAADDQACEIAHVHIASRHEPHSLGTCPPQRQTLEEEAAPAAAFRRCHSDQRRHANTICGTIAAHFSG